MRLPNDSPSQVPFTIAEGGRILEQMRVIEIDVNGAASTVMRSVTRCSKRR
jgi:hypothetical protein